MAIVPLLVFITLRYQAVAFMILRQMVRLHVFFFFFSVLQIRAIFMPLYLFL